MSIATLFAELRRRRVFRVASVYAIVAWLVVQVAATTSPLLGLPGWVARLVLLLVVLGFPIALVLAWAFEVTPDGLRRTDPPAPSGDMPPAPADAPRAMRRSVVFVLGFLIALSGAWFLTDRSGSGGGAINVNVDVVAVLPFRVSADPSLDYLREGMLDLLAAKLTGQGGPRAVDPRTLMAAWRAAGGTEATDLTQAEAETLAVRLGAGRLLLGEVIGTPAQLVLNASVARIGGDRTRHTATVSGPADSLPGMVDRLAAQLLALEAGEDEQRLEMLLTTSMPALRAYLRGQAEYRRGRIDASTSAFREAIALDSTFALAGVGLARSASWNRGDVTGIDQGLAVAAAGLDRLSRRDRVLVELTIPESPDAVSGAERILLAERLVAERDDEADAWNLLAEEYMHHGSLTGRQDWKLLAADAFDRAIELDSTFMPSFFHRIELAAIGRDTAVLHRLYPRLDLEQGIYGAQVMRWLRAAAEGDERELATMEDEAGGMSLEDIASIPVRSQQDQLGIEAARRLLDAYLRAASHRERGDAASLTAEYLRNQGRPEAARAVMREHGSALSTIELVRELHWASYTGDGASGERMAERLERVVAASFAIAPRERMQQYAAIAARGQWALATGDRAGAERALQRLRQAPLASDPRRVRGVGQIGALTLEALLSGSGGRPDPAAVARLDSILRLAVAGDDDLATAAGNVTVAGLHEALNDHAAALQAIRRRYPYQLLLLSESLRMEGRLAGVVGDRAAATRAYRHYLALQIEPEATARADIAAVRAELARLERT